ncbi:MAG: glycosyltransferase [Candidatus Parvarchaeota archaeon]|nr:glycosyltransferase [Candidatus Jingweiarchaeum tengchongense]MCW1298404.1 glycosyltransferase [Candidatus Jingweiarchaeum tengchongense]MCW1300294.1 glycosyltransferase [Candidatus Jingweiarchaeum tengchongense]MCW1304910.1 glycosyltransferase [Candidatus Jingweiarchaeum tengchongense]MCW1306148.1 glycosyltransferase [Candidatus Jingweiarchaeum tengchongense]
MKSFTIGICAYNEEKNIGKLLSFLLNENFIFKLNKILIVAGGNDNTIKIVKGFQSKSNKIELIHEKKRMGKASAINLILKKARGEFIVLVSGDNLPKKDSINLLLKHFEDKDVGGVGGRPLPINKQDDCISNIGKLIWELHHRVSLTHPKLSGEMCAIRNGILRKIPQNIINDDGYIEGMIEKRNYRILYEPKAITFMHTPSSISKLLKQRRRIARGYIQLKQMKIDVSMRLRNVIYELSRVIATNPSEIPMILIAILIESSANLLAYIDTLTNYTPYCWERFNNNKKV